MTIPNTPAFGSVAATVTGTITVPWGSALTVSGVAGTGTASLPDATSGAMYELDVAAVAGAAETSAGLVPGFIELGVSRLDGGTGTVVTSNGVPLVPGQLFAADVGGVRLVVGGSEIACYVEALTGTHSDGSLRSILLQASVDTDSVTAATLYMTGAAVERRTKQAVSYTEVAANPQNTGPAAVMLPSSVDHLLACDLIPNLRSRAVDILTALGTEQDDALGTHLTERWNAYASYSGSDNMAGANYYDRAYCEWTQWIRTGTVLYWKRAAAYVLNYRIVFLQPNSYGIQPHQWQVDGMGLGYWLLGEDEFVTGMQTVGNMFENSPDWDGSLGVHGTSGQWGGEGRPQARILLTFLWLIKLGNTLKDWASELDDGLIACRDGTNYSTANNGNLTWWGYSSGGVNGGNNFMTLMVADAYARCYDEYRADAWLLTRIKAHLDFLWTQWKSDGYTHYCFGYLTTTVPGEGNPDPAMDLNGFYPHMWAWYGATASDSAYLTIADTIMDNTFNTAYDYDNPGGGPYLAPDKQTNENAHFPYQYWGARY